MQHEGQAWYCPGGESYFGAVRRPAEVSKVQNDDWQISTALNVLT